MSMQLELSALSTLIQLLYQPSHYFMRIREILIKESKGKTL
jgi:hypothetical protein